MAMLNMLVKCAALETSFFGIRVNAVAAGVTATQARQKKESLGFSDAQNKQYLLEQAQDIPLQNQINLPKDVSRIILWISSSDASFVTGEILTIDGGQSITTNRYGDYLKELEQSRGAGDGFAAQLFGGGSGK